MKSGTKNLLLLGAAGLGAYFLFVKPALNKTPAELGQEAGGAVAGGVVGFGEGLLNGAIGFNNGIIGAVVAPFQAIIDSLLRAGANIAQPSSVAAPAVSAPVLASSFNNTTYRPANVTAALTQNTAQQAVSQQFGVSAPSSVNYLASVGRGTPAATWSGQSGTYQASTGTFTNTSGQGFSVASYYVKPAATYAPATKPAVYVPSCPPVVKASPLAVSKPAYFK